MDSMNGDDSVPTLDRDLPSMPPPLGGNYRESGYASTLDEARPFGVSLIVTVIVLATIVNAFFALNAWIRAQELDETPALAFALIIEVIVSMGVAVGLWRLNEWGRVTAIALYVISFGIRFFTGFNETLTTGALVGLVVPLAIVIYLIQPNVRDRFI